MAAKKTSKSTTTSDAAEATEKLSKRAASGDKGALAAVTEIVTSYNQVQDAKERKVKVAKTAKSREEQEFAAVKNAIEDSLPTDAGAQTVLGKLQTIEQSWQDYQEALAQGVEERKESKEALKAAEKRFERAVKDSAQLALDFE